MTDINQQLQKIEFILLQSQNIQEPLEIDIQGFQSAVNIFAHAMVDNMYRMADDLEIEDEDFHRLGASFNDDLSFIIKQYTNIKPTII